MRQDDINEIKTDRKTLDAILEKYGKEDVMRFLNTNFDDDEQNYFNNFSAADSGMKEAWDHTESIEDVKKYWRPEWSKYFRPGQKEYEANTCNEFFNDERLFKNSLHPKYFKDVLMALWFPEDDNDCQIAVKKCGNNLGGVPFSPFDDSFLFIIWKDEDKKLNAGLYVIDDFSGDPFEIVWDFDYVCKKKNLPYPTSLLQVINLLYIILEETPV